jgi:glucan phosphoethanolaminetransferase (alkaline phosphatase superfamily)
MAESVLAVSVIWKTLPVVVVAVAVGWWAIARFKLPFAAGLFWKTLAVVAVLVVITWTIVLKFTSYEIMPADYGGTILSTLIFSYLVHLWIMPHDELMVDDGVPHDETDGSTTDN